MPPLSLNLPDALRARAQARAASAGRATLETYIESLIVADMNAVEEDPGAPGHVTFRSSEQLEKLVLDGLASGAPAVLTDADWDEKRRRLIGRAGQSKK